MDYKEFVITKKGKSRKICAPDAELKKEQQKILKRLYREYDNISRLAKLPNDIVHGFLPNKNVVTAAKKHIGFKSTIMMDISSFFDTVHRDMFKKYEFKRLDYLFNKEGTTSQGFCTSPILANISTVHMVNDINDYLKENIIDFAFTIYADDIQISTLLEDSSILQDIIKNVTKIVEDYSFKINERKTRIKFSKYGWRRILGINVGNKFVRATRATMRKIRAAKHQSNHNSLGGLVTWSKCYEPSAVNKNKANVTCNF